MNTCADVHDDASCGTENAANEGRFSRLKPDASSILCPNGICDYENCCVLNTCADVHDDASCGTENAANEGRFSRLKPDASTILCPNGICEYENCCVENTCADVHDDASCGTENGENLGKFSRLKPDASSILCPNGICEYENCCVKKTCVDVYPTTLECNQFGTTTYAPRAGNEGAECSLVFSAEQGGSENCLSPRTARDFCCFDTSDHSCATYFQSDTDCLAANVAFSGGTPDYLSRDPNRLCLYGDCTSEASARACCNGEKPTCTLAHENNICAVSALFYEKSATYACHDFTCTTTQCCGTKESCHSGTRSDYDERWVCGEDALYRKDIRKGSNFCVTNRCGHADKDTCCSKRATCSDVATDGECQKDAPYWYSFPSHRRNVESGRSHALPSQFSADTTNADALCVGTTALYKDYFTCKLSNTYDATQCCAFQEQYCDSTFTDAVCASSIYGSYFRLKPDASSTLCLDGMCTKGVVGDIYEPNYDVCCQARTCEDTYPDTLSCQNVLSEGWTPRLSNKLLGCYDKDVDGMEVDCSAVANANFCCFDTSVHTCKNYFPGQLECANAGYDRVPEYLSGDSERECLYGDCSNAEAIAACCAGEKPTCNVAQEQGLCSAESLENKDSNTVCAGFECIKSDCCQTPTCSGAQANGICASADLFGDATYRCADYECTQDECCVKPTCGESGVCGAESLYLRDASLQCAGHTCLVNECCVERERCGFAMDSQYKINQLCSDGVDDGYILKESSRYAFCTTYNCGDDSADKDLCCRKTVACDEVFSDEVCQDVGPAVHPLARPQNGQSNALSSQFKLNTNNAKKLCSGNECNVDQQDDVGLCCTFTEHRCNDPVSGFSAQTCRSKEKYSGVKDGFDSILCLDGICDTANDASFDQCCKTKTCEDVYGDNYVCQQKGGELLLGTNWIARWTRSTQPCNDRGLLSGIGERFADCSGPDNFAFCCKKSPSHRCREYYPTSDACKKWGISVTTPYQMTVDHGVRMCANGNCNSQLAAEHCCLPPDEWTEGTGVTCESIRDTADAFCAEDAGAFNEANANKYCIGSPACDDHLDASLCCTKGNRCSDGFAGFDSVADFCGEDGRSKEHDYLSFRNCYPDANNPDKCRVSDVNKNRCCRQHCKVGFGNNPEWCRLSDEVYFDENKENYPFGEYCLGFPCQDEHPDDYRCCENAPRCDDWYNDAANDDVCPNHERNMYGKYYNPLLTNGEEGSGQNVCCGRLKDAPYCRDVHNNGDFCDLNSNHLAVNINRNTQCKTHTCTQEECCGQKQQCKEAFEVEGAEDIVCHSDGMWDPTKAENYCGNNVCDYLERGTCCKDVEQCQDLFGQAENNDCQTWGPENYVIDSSVNGIRASPVSSQIVYDSTKWSKDCSKPGCSEDDVQTCCKVEPIACNNPESGFTDLLCTDPSTLGEYKGLKPDAANIMCLGGICDHNHFTANREDFDSYNQCCEPADEPGAYPKCSLWHERLCDLSVEHAILINADVRCNDYACTNEECCGFKETCAEAMQKEGGQTSVCGYGYVRDESKNNSHCANEFCTLEDDKDTCCRPAPRCKSFFNDSKCQELGPNHHDRAVSTFYGLKARALPVQFAANSSQADDFCTYPYCNEEDVNTCCAFIPQNCAQGFSNDTCTKNNTEGLFTRENGGIIGGIFTSQTFYSGMNGGIIGDIITPQTFYSGVKDNAADIECLDGICDVGDFRAQEVTDFDSFAHCCKPQDKLCVHAHREGLCNDFELSLNAIKKCEGECTTNECCAQRMRCEQADEANTCGYGFYLNTSAASNKCATEVCGPADKELCCAEKMRCQEADEVSLCGDGLVLSSLTASDYCTSSDCKTPQDKDLCCEPICNGEYKWVRPEPQLEDQLANATKYIPPAAYENSGYDYGPTSTNTYDRHGNLIMSWQAGITTISGKPHIKYGRTCVDHSNAVDIWDETPYEFANINFYNNLQQFGDECSAYCRRQGFHHQLMVESSPADRCFCSKIDCQSERDSYPFAQIIERRCVEPKESCREEYIARGKICTNLNIDDVIDMSELSYDRFIRYGGLKASVSFEVNIDQWAKDCSVIRKYNYASGKLAANAGDQLLAKKSDPKTCYVTSECMSEGVRDANLDDDEFQLVVDTCVTCGNQLDGTSRRNASTNTCNNCSTGWSSSGEDDCAPWKECGNYHPDSIYGNTSRLENASPSAVGECGECSGEQYEATSEKEDCKLTKCDLGAQPLSSLNLGFVYNATRYRQNCMSGFLNDYNSYRRPFSCTIFCADGYTTNTDTGVNAGTLFCDLLEEVPLYMSIPLKECLP